MIRRSTAALVAAASLVVATAALAADPPSFADPERAAALPMGPWPLPANPDPSNRYSGNPVAIRFGKALFFDDGLSRFGALSCARCHKPDRAWTDGRTRASAAAELDRNTPALFNLRHLRWYGWDGGADSLWMQSIRPLLDPREMAASPIQVRAHIAKTPALAADFRRLVGVKAERVTPEHALVITAKALAAFQETLVTGRSEFDAFRDALIRYDPDAIARYPAEARRGFALFIGRGSCMACHAGPLFTDHSFHDIGVATTGPDGRVDRGRAVGLAKLKASPFTRRGPFSDARRDATARITRQTVRETAHPNAFRVPSLRNVAMTAPYMHDGSSPTLADAIRRHRTTPDLSQAEIDSLVAFLATLTAN